MRPMAVVVVDVLCKDDFELTPVEDQHPVETLAADGTDEAFGKSVGSGGRIGVRMVRIRSERNTSSKSVVNLASRFQTKNLTRSVRSASTMVRFRACWTTQAGVRLVLDFTPVYFLLKDGRVD